MRKSPAILLVLIFSVAVHYSCMDKETTAAKLHNHHGVYDKAIEQATLAIEKNPNNAEARFQLGISYSFIGNMRGAYDEYMAAIRLEPKRENDIEVNIRHNWAKHFNNGVAEYQGDNLEGAAKEFELATQADPRQVKGWLNLAKVFSTLGEEDSTYNEKSYEAVDTLLAKTPPDDDQYGNVLALSGKVMIRRGMKGEAIDIFERLMADDPTNFEIVEEIGTEYLAEDNYEDAIRFYRMAVDGRRRTDSEEYDLYYNYGIALYKLERYMDSMDSYQSALQMRPGDKQASYSLLLTYYQAEFYDEAILEGQKYTTEIAPDDPRGWQILSLSYNKRGMKIKAEEAFQKYKELKGE